MKRLTLVLVLMALSLTLTGCWDSRPVDELGLIGGVMVEETAANELEVGIIRPTFEKDKKESDYKKSTQAETLVDALNNLQQRSSKIYQVGSIRSVMIGKNLAHSGIDDLLQELDHINDFETQALIVVFDGTFQDLEEFNPPHEAISGKLILDTLISMNRAQQIAQTQFYRVMISRSIEGQELVLPFIRLDEKKENIEVYSFAVFKGDVMVGSISLEEGIPYIMIRRPHIDELLINIPRNELQGSIFKNLSVVLRRKTSKISTEVQQNKPVINVDFKLTVDLKSIRTRDSIEPDDEILKAEIERVVAQYLKNSCDSLFEKTQKEFESDIFGFGEKVRVQNYSYYKNISWPDIYPEAQISCNFQVKLREVGGVR